MPAELAATYQASRSVPRQFDLITFLKREPHKKNGGVLSGLLGSIVLAWRPLNEINGLIYALVDSSDTPWTPTFLQFWTARVEAQTAEIEVMGTPITAHNTTSWAKCALGDTLISGGFRNAPASMNLPDTKHSHPAEDRQHRSGWLVITQAPGSAYAVCAPHHDASRSLQDGPSLKKYQKSGKRLFADPIVKNIES